MRVRDLLRQIGMEHEVHILSGKVAKDHIHVFISYRPNQSVSQRDSTMAEGYQFTSHAARICTFGEAVLGSAFVGERISGSQLRNNYRRDDTEIY